MTTNERLTRPAADRVVAEEATGRGAGARTSAVSQAGCLPLFPSGTSCRYTTRGQVSSIHLYVVVGSPLRSEEHTSELQSRPHLVCRLLLEKKKLFKDKFTINFEKYVFAIARLAYLPTFLMPTT